MYKRAAVKSFIAGFRDALWPGAFIYVVTSPLIRKRFSQCCILNGFIFLGSIGTFKYLIKPLFVAILQLSGFSSTSTEWAEWTVDNLYNAIWVLPLYIFSFVANSLWYQDIAQQAHSLYSSSMHRESIEIKEEFIKRSKSRSTSNSNSPNPPSSSSISSSISSVDSASKPIQSSLNSQYLDDPNPLKWRKSKKSSKSRSRSSKSKKRKSQSSLDLFSSIRDRISGEIHHILFLIVFNVQIVIFSKMGTICSVIAWNLNYVVLSLLFDYIGIIIAVLLFSWQHAYFSFEYKWIMSEVPLQHRIRYFEERIPYFSGFGTPLTLLILTAPQFVSTGIYALTFPLFIIQAIESQPVHKAASGNDIFGIGKNEKMTKPLRIPVFATTQWLEYAVIWFCGNYFCCIRAVLVCIQKCGKVLGI